MRFVTPRRVAMIAVLLTALVAVGTREASARGCGWGCGWSCCYTPCCSCCCCCCCCCCDPWWPCGVSCWPPAAPAHPANTGPISAVSPSKVGEGVLVLTVPENAKVVVNGNATPATGAHREFVVKDLQDGLRYKFVVRALVTSEGKTIEETKTIFLQLGDVKTLALNFSRSDATQVASAH
jgi:uncharacterized protein (TIGR03000 family)